MKPLKNPQVAHEGCRGPTGPQGSPKADPWGSCGSRKASRSLTGPRANLKENRVGCKPFRAIAELPGIKQGTWAEYGREGESQTGQKQEDWAAIDRFGKILIFTDLRIFHFWQLFGRLFLDSPFQADLKISTTRAWISFSVFFYWEFYCTVVKIQIYIWGTFLNNFLSHLIYKMSY